MRILWVLFLSLPVLAEFRQVEIKVSGLDCQSCAESLPKVLERMRGVESAAMDDKAGLVTVKLKTGNKISLEDLRDKLKQAGYTPGDARLHATGTLVSEEGKWRFQPAGVSRSYGVAIPESWKPSAGETVELNGTASGDQIKVSQIRKTTENPEKR